jgi:hypothetical protein
MVRRWEEYQSFRTGLYDGRIHVTVNSRGNIYLNRRALEALNMPEAVVLLFDPGSKTIGIRRAAAERRNAHRLKTKDVKGLGKMVYAADFLRHYGISISETLAFEMPELDEDGILVLNLSETIRTGKRKAKP